MRSLRATSRLGALFIMLTVAFTEAKGAGVGRNSGDSVLCVKTTDNAWEGAYALDFMVAALAGSAYAEPKSAEAALDRVSELLHRKWDLLANLFDSYRADLDNETDYGRPYLWLKMQTQLVDIKDEDLLAVLPDNCVDGRTGQPRIRQAITQERLPSGLTTLHADRDLLDVLKTERPLQYAFLIVHEWLWTIADKAESVRAINRLLHDPTSQAMEPRAFRHALRRLGVTITAADAFLFPCDRQVAVKNALEAITQKPCQEIVAEDLRKVTGLDLSSQGLTNIGAGDLSGLSSLRTLNLSHNALTSLSAPLLQGLSRLQVLRLDDNRLESLEEGIFDGVYDAAGFSLLNLSRNRLRNLDWLKVRTAEAWDRRPVFADVLDLSHNQLASLPVSWLVRSVRLSPSIEAHFVRHLILHDNGIARIDGDLPPNAGLRRIEDVDLRRNKLSDLRRDLPSKGEDFAVQFYLNGNPTDKAVQKELLATYRGGQRDPDNDRRFLRGIALDFTSDPMN